MALVVEIFPVALDRWVAVVEAPLGAFSTECDSPAAIAEELQTPSPAYLGQAKHGTSSMIEATPGIQIARRNS